LLTMVLPDGITSIGEGAFRSCRALTTINIPEGITVLSQSVFARCPALTNVSLPSTLTSIGENAFGECLALTDLAIPSGVQDIGRVAFVGSALTNVTIPASVTTIGEYAFAQCPDLTNVTFQSSKPPANIGPEVFGIDALPNPTHNNPGFIVNLPSGSLAAYSATAEPTWNAYFPYFVEGSSSVPNTDGTPPDAGSTLPKTGDTLDLALPLPLILTLSSLSLLGVLAAIVTQKRRASR
jgi:hypothetical protein